MTKEGKTGKKKSVKRAPKKVPVQTEAPAVETTVAAEPGQLATSPGFRDYALATFQLIGSNIKQHKLRFVTGVVVTATVVVLAGWLLWPSPGPLTHEDIVLQVNRELSIQGDSNPAILTVEDKSKATQPFLQGAENGDKVLLYYKAKKSVLFRPSEKRIVHQGVYTPPDAKVFVRQGTESADSVDKIKESLSGIDDLELVSQDLSHRRDYQGVTIVSVTDRYDEKLQELSQALGASVSRLPEGESFPEADILIIVGD